MEVSSVKVSKTYFTWVGLVAFGYYHNFRPKNWWHGEWCLGHWFMWIESRGYSFWSGDGAVCCFKSIRNIILLMDFTNLQEYV